MPISAGTDCLFKQRSISTLSLSAIYGYEVLIAFGTGSIVQAGYAVIQTIVPPAEMSYGITYTMVGTLESSLSPPCSFRNVHQLTEVLRVGNPVRQSWADVCSILERKINLAPRSRLPFKEWLARVSMNESHPTDLIEFYSKYFLNMNMSGGGLVLDTTNCRALSPTLRSTGAIGPDEIELCLDFWHRKGFLN